MSKKLSYIIIPLLMLAIFLAPISPILKNQNGILKTQIEINKTRAQTSTEAEIVISRDSIDSTSVSLTITANDPNNQYYETTVLGALQEGKIAIGMVTKADWDSKAADPTYFLKATFSKEKQNDKNVPQKITITPKDLLKPLTLKTDYIVFAYMGKVDVTFWKLITLNTQNMIEGVKLSTLLITTPDENGNGLSIGSNQVVIDNPAPFNFNCGVTKLGGCIAEIFYSLWEACAFVAHLAGRFLDFFVYYSTNSSSYTSEFVTNGFKVIRDVANIFFIIALLYVAIKTILDLNTSNNKKLIGSIVIIALLINFSLFFSQVIIDSTNILAKVFYNQISNQDENGKKDTTGSAGEKSISVGLVKEFNPQVIITQDDYKNGSHGEGTVGTFIFVTLFAIFITLYTAYVFFTVAILFVGRVVMLWLSMIFAPIAFASYTFPVAIPGIGHKDWWDNLLKNSFLAPVFIFFLYIIVMFAKFLDTIGKYASGSDTSTYQGMINHLMHVLIPFAILMILLMKAKDMTVKLSGEMGKALGGIVKSIGGVALGAVGFAGGLALGGAAALGQKTIGRASAAMGRTIGGKSRFARFFKNKFTDAGNASYNIAAIPGAGKLLSKVGIKDSKPKYANYEERVKAKEERKRKRAKQMEVQPTDREAVDVRKAKVNLEKEKTALANKTQMTYDTEVDAATGEIKIKYQKDAAGNLIKYQIDNNGKYAKDTAGNYIVDTTGGGRAMGVLVSKNLNEIETNLKRLDTKLSVREKLLSEADKELKTELAKQNLMSKDERNSVINRNKIIALQNNFNAAKADKEEIVTYIVHNGDRKTLMGNDVHHAEVALVKAENILAARNKQKVGYLAKGIEKGRFFNILQVGGQEEAERLADEIRIKTASENVEKKAPTAPSKTHQK